MAKTTDKPRKVRRFNPARARKAETSYSLQLRKVARVVGEIVNGYSPEDASEMRRLTASLRMYSEAIHDWASITAAKMLEDVSKREEQSWLEHAAEMSRNLGKEIRSAPTGQVMQELLGEQVTLIKSIPLEAANRVHELTIKGLEDSTRASEISKMIMESGNVAKSRANLIARTEVSRTATALTEARAKHIGSDSYIWRTSGDSDVRPDHAELNGKVFRWDTPPIADKRTGARAHAGCIYACRCWAEPVIADSE